MKLSDHQWAFLKDLATLILFAEDQGYKLTGAELYRTPAHAKRNAAKGVGIADSLHCQRLAIDLNLFIDDKFRRDSEAHRPLGEFWESLDPRNNWGGDFKKPDGNHYERVPD
ncbi:MAG: hypothetical protein COA83_09690 [Methylophaga sp.]|nr:MAG: hypothetical protein COA83_09690 [Methylophaga sp.]